MNTHVKRRPPVALTIAGSDPSGGAGIQADLKTFSALGAYGTTVITALTAQNTQGVTAVHAVPAGFLREQWRTLVADVKIDAIKIGMLSHAALVDLVGEFIDERRSDCVVLDPVMVATSGDRLLDEDAIDAMRRLVPRASLITPNLSEAAVLLDVEPARSVAEMKDQAEALVDRGAQRALVKGGHLPGMTEAGPAQQSRGGHLPVMAESVDVFAGPEGVHLVRAPYIDTNNTHGTGCTLSSAITALRPRRTSWPEAVCDAKRWLSGALAAADQLEIGQGTGPVHHFHDTWGREA